MNEKHPRPIFEKAAWIAAICITASAILLHFFSFSVVGALWRDEVGMANIHKLATMHEIFDALLHDHCPMLFPLVMRTAAALGMPETDFGLRAFGLCVGLSLIAAFWIASRMMGRGLPLISLSLVALNPMVIRFGDSLRAYALGMVFIIVTMGLIWRFIEKANVGRGLLAGIAAVISVQTLYQNAFFLLAICVAGVVVSIRRRQWTVALCLLLIGFVAAISLLPYVKPIHDAQTWWVVSQSGINLHIVLSRLRKLTGGFFEIWVFTAAVAVALGLSRFFRPAQNKEKVEQNDLPLFGAIALVLGSIGFGVFIKMSGLPTQFWYYIPIFCFTAACCDAVLPRAFPITRFGVIVLALIALAFSPSAYSALRWRQTNCDLIVAQVEKDSSAGDFILVHPWYYGITFSYYYHGTANWATLPPIADYSYHRYDLIKEKLATPHAIEPVMEQAETALRTGHRVWIVGELSAPPSDKTAPADPPVAPNGPLGWSDQPYTEAWGNQMSYLLVQHATNITLFVDPATNSILINPMEPMALIGVSGWKTKLP